MYIEIYKSNDNLYVAACPDLELFSKGRTKEEAVRNLEESITSFLVSAEKTAEIKEDLEETARFYSLRYPQKH